jgi:hypothetical protein
MPSSVYTLPISIYINRLKGLCADRRLLMVSIYNKILLNNVPKRYFDTNTYPMDICFVYECSYDAIYDIYSVLMLACIPVITRRGIDALPDSFGLRPVKSLSHWIPINEHEVRRDIKLPHSMPSRKKTGMRCSAPEPSRIRNGYTTALIARPVHKNRYLSR